MRRIILLIFALLVALIIAGCSAIPMTQPQVALPVRLAAISFEGDGQLYKTSVDMSENERWVRNTDHIEALEEIGLSMGVTNETGESGNPSPVLMRLYVSEYQNLTVATLDQAEFAMEMTLPGGQREVRYDAGTALSPAAGKVMRDGRFFLYAAAYPNTARLAIREIDIQLKARVSML